MHNPEVENRNLDASVIIVGYNQPQTIKWSILSLIGQSNDADFEIIVSDDGSSADFFRDNRDLLNDSQVPIKYVWQQDRSFRAGEARNNGIELSRGNTIIFLDGDIIPSDSLVDQHLLMHEENTKSIISGNRLWRGNIIDHPEIEQLNCTDELLVYLENTTPDDVSLRRENNERAIRKKLNGTEKSWQNSYGCHVSYRYSDSLRYDKEIVGWSLEDWELAYRMHRNHGYSAYYNDEIDSFHIETSAAVNNIFRVGLHEDIVQYALNHYYVDKLYPNVFSLEELMYGFARFELNHTTNEWRIIPRQAEENKNLELKVNQMYDWLHTYESERLCRMLSRVAFSSKV